MYSAQIDAAVFRVEIAVLTRKTGAELVHQSGAHRPVVGERDDAIVGVHRSRIVRVDSARPSGNVTRRALGPGLVVGQTETLLVVKAVVDTQRRVQDRLLSGN